MMLRLLKKWLGKEETAPQPRPDWIIVGLGNPGAQYAHNRHNIGFLVLDEVPSATSYLRLKPQTFMNLSGDAVGPLARQHGIAPEHIVVVHDELDLPAGTVRVKLGGNENGHNGLKSITQALGTRDYLRVRVGIGRPPRGTSITDWVLGDITEEATLAAVERAVQAAVLLTEVGLQATQNQIHSKK